MTELTVVGVVLDTKLLLESHIRSIAASASSKLGIVRKALYFFRDPVLVLRCFWCFLLAVLEYFPPVRMITKASHLGILETAVSNAVRLSAGLVTCDL